MKDIKERANSFLIFMRFMVGKSVVDSFAVEQFAVEQNETGPVRSRGSGPEYQHIIVAQFSAYFSRFCTSIV
jgi:hypothetical protein